MTLENKVRNVCPIKGTPHKNSNTFWLTVAWGVGARRTASPRFCEQPTGPQNKVNKHTFLRLPAIAFTFIFLSLAIFPINALSLDETLKTLDLVSVTEKPQFRWDPLLQDGIFNMGEHFGVFSTASKEGESGYLLFNNRELFNVPLPYNKNGELNFPEAFVITLKDAFVKSFENDASRFRVTTIIIDPGHGGKDPGAVGKHTINGKNTTVSEKDIVLKTAIRLRDLLSQAYPDKKILMTRDSDFFRTLEQRSDIANAVHVRDNESVIFISIHANASVNSNARGYEVWHITSGQKRNLLKDKKNDYSPDIMAILEAMLEEEFTTESIVLADSILAAFNQQLGAGVPSRGRKANDWFVVRNSRMPAVLVELGFVSNRQDAILMTSEEGLNKLTLSLYNGIKDFIGIFER